MIDNVSDDAVKMIMLYSRNYGKVLLTPYSVFPSKLNNPAGTSPLTYYANEDGMEEKLKRHDVNRVAECSIEPAEVLVGTE